MTDPNEILSSTVQVPSEPRFLGLSKVGFIAFFVMLIMVGLLFMGGAFFLAQERGDQYRAAIQYNCTTNGALLRLVDDAIKNTEANIKAGTYLRLLHAGTITQREYDQIQPSLDEYKAEDAILRANGPCRVVSPARSLPKIPVASSSR